MTTYASKIMRLSKDESFQNSGLIPSSDLGFQDQNIQEDFFQMIRRYHWCC